MRYVLALSALIASAAAAQTELPPVPVPQGEQAVQGPAAPADAPPIPPWLKPPRYQDPRLRDVPYSPNEVVQLAVAPGRQMGVIFASGEKVQSVAVGDSASWQVTASRAGDSLFVKPTSAFAATNMTVITDSRTYLFDLVASASADAVYLVRFQYPEAAAADESVTGQTAQERLAPGVYRLGGTRALRPDSIRDDGSKTYLAWGERKAMPAVFAIGSAGEEMLVDGYVRGGVYTVDRVYGKLIFRFNKKTATAVRR